MDFSLKKGAINEFFLLGFVPSDLADSVIQPISDTVAVVLFQKQQNLVIYIEYWGLIYFKSGVTYLTSWRLNLNGRSNLIMRIFLKPFNGNDHASIDDLVFPITVFIANCGCSAREVLEGWRREGRPAE